MRTQRTQVVADCYGHSIQDYFLLHGPSEKQWTCAEKNLCVNWVPKFFFAMYVLILHKCQNLRIDLMIIVAGKVFIEIYLATSKNIL